MSGTVSGDGSRIFFAKGGAYGVRDLATGTITWLNAAALPFEYTPSGATAVVSNIAVQAVDSSGYSFVLTVTFAVSDTVAPVTRSILWHPQTNGGTLIGDAAQSVIDPTRVDISGNGRYVIFQTKGDDGLHDQAILISDRVTSGYYSWVPDPELIFDRGRPLFGANHLDAISDDARVIRYTVIWGNVRSDTRLLDRISGEVRTVDTAAWGDGPVVWSDNSRYAFAGGKVFDTMTGAVVGAIEGSSDIRFVSNDGSFVYGVTGAALVDGDSGYGADLYKLFTGSTPGAGLPPIQLTRHAFTAPDDIVDTVVLGVSTNGAVIHAVTAHPHLAHGAELDPTWTGTGEHQVAIDVPHLDVPEGPTAGHDRLYGTPDADTIDGLGGDDVIHGDEGNDTLFGSGGRDILHGEAGNDILHGGADTDELLGGDGGDQLFGDAGNDTFHLDAGDDAIDGGAGYDRIILGGARADYVLLDEVGADGRPTGKVTITNAVTGVDTVTGVEAIDFAIPNTNVAHVGDVYVTLAKAATAAFGPAANIGDGWIAMTAMEFGLPIIGSNAVSGVHWTFANGIFKASVAGVAATQAMAQVYFGNVDGTPTVLVGMGAIDALTDPAIAGGAPPVTLAQAEALFAPFLQMLSEHSNGTTVWIGAHGLAGSATQQWLEDYAFGDVPSLRLATFGSPGADPLFLDQRVVHFEHAGDALPLAGDHVRYLAANGHDVSGLSDAMKAALEAAGNAVGGRVDLAPSGDVVQITRPVGLSADPILSHAMAGYLETISIIAADNPNFNYHSAGDQSGHISIVVGTSGIDTLGVSPTDLVDALRGAGYGAAQAILGGGEADVLIGGGGSDWLIGGSGADTMTGGAGRDAFAIDGTSRDVVTDFVAGAGGDLLDLRFALDALDLDEQAFAKGFLRFAPKAGGMGTVLLHDADGRGGSDAVTEIAALDGVDIATITLDNVAGVSSITLALLNDPAQAEVTFIEDSGAVALMAGVTLGDPGARYAGGSFAITVADPEAGIVLAAGATLRVAVSGGVPCLVTSLGDIVGTVSGIGTNTLTVTALTAAATPAVLADALRAFAVVVPGDTPTGGDFATTLTLTVGDRHTSVAQMLHVVPVDDPAIAVDDAASIDADGYAFVTGTFNDIDVDTNIFRIDKIAGQSVASGDTITLASGAQVIFLSGTFVYDPNHKFDDVRVGQTATDSFTYTLDSGSTATVTVTIAGIAPAIISGTSADDVIAGTSAGDVFDLSQGGHDTASGGGGDDGFYFGGALDALDRVDGGAGTGDQLGLQGDYAGPRALVLGAQNLVGVETLVLMLGSDTRFGDTAGRLYGYTLTSVDANVAAGDRLVVNMNTLRVGEDVVFDGSAERDGSFLFYGGKGVEQLTGGAGDDGFYFGSGAFGASDRVIGGAGDDDQLGLQGDYTLAFGANQLSGIETIVLLGAGDARFGGGGSGYSYDLTLNDANATGTLKVNANTLATGESLRLDGSAEHDAALTLIGGAGRDTLIGGHIADTLFGGLGADTLTGGAGPDTFVYTAAAQSTGATYDTITDFDAAADVIDLAGSASDYHRIADRSATLSIATLDADLTQALGASLDAHGIGIVTASSGTLAGHSFLVVDVNGTAGYQAGSDILIDLGIAILPPTGLAFVA